MNRIPQARPKVLHLAATALTLVALAFATGCHKKTATPPSSAYGPTVDNTAAPTATLTADPPAVDAGQSVVLNWRTTNSTVITIDGIGTVPTSGTQNVSPATSTNYRLIARNDAGQSAEANVRVTVRVAAPPAPIADTSGNMGSDAAFHQNVQDAFFDYDSYELRPDAVQAAVQAASYLTAHPEIKVLIAGYSDERGSAEYNLALGENRSNTARVALITAGIAANRIRIVSYGKEKQFCSESDEACYQQNRRAQFSIDR